MSDRLYYKGILQKPSSSAAGDHVDIISSPKANGDSKNLADLDENLKDYRENPNLRKKLKRSIARSSMAK
jgi:hypothetical protein